MQLKTVMAFAIGLTVVALVLEVEYETRFKDLQAAPRLPEEEEHKLVETPADKPLHHELNSDCLQKAKAFQEPYTQDYVPTGERVDTSSTQWSFYQHEGRITYDDMERAASVTKHRLAKFKILDGRLYYWDDDFMMAKWRMKIFMSGVLLALDKYQIPDMDFYYDPDDFTLPPGGPLFQNCGNNSTGNMHDGFTVPYPKTILHSLGPTQISVQLSCLDEKYGRANRIPKVVWRGTSWFIKSPPDNVRLHARESAIISGLKIPQFTDIKPTGFAGPPGPESYKCNAWANITKDGWCPDPEERFSVDEFSKYAFVLDVDGRGWSGRLQALMTRSTPILKQISRYPDYLTPFTFKDKVVEFVKTDMSDFEQKVKEILLKRSEAPLMYHNNLVQKMQEFSGVHLTHFGVIRAMAYALTVYAEKITWVPKMEDGFFPVAWDQLIFPESVPTQVLDRIKNKIKPGEKEQPSA